MACYRPLAIAVGAAAGLAVLGAAHPLRPLRGALAQEAGAAADLVRVDALGGRARAVAALDGATVVAAVGGRVEVLDVAGTTGPRLIGRTPPLSGAPLSVAAGGALPGGVGAVALAALGPHGLAVVDVRDPGAPHVTARTCLAAVAPTLPLSPVPPRPPLVGCDAGRSQRAVETVALSADGTIGVAAFGRAVLVVDLAQPYGVRGVAWVDVGAPVTALAVDGDRALALAHPFAGDDAGNQIVVIDVREPAAPFARGRLKLGGDPLAFGALAAAGGTAVAGGRQGGAVVDLRDADRPRLLARIDRAIEAVAIGQVGGRPVTALALTRPVLADSGVQVPVYDDIALLDLSTPRGPRQLAQHVARLDRGLTGIALAPSGADDGWLAAASRLGGVEAFTTTIAGLLPPRGTRTTGTATLIALDARGRVVVVEGGEHEGGRARLAVYEPGAATADGVVDGLELPRSVAVAGDRAYVVEARGVRTVALDGGAPRTIGFWSAGLELVELAAGAGWLAVSDGEGTVQIVDPRLPDVWRPLAALPAVDRFAPADLAAAGDRLYVAADDRLALFDLSDPRAPRSLGQVRHDTDGSVAFERPRLAVADGRLWLADPTGGVVGYDVRAERPRLIARVRSLRADGITAVGDRAYVAVVPDESAAPDAAVPDGDGLAVVVAPFGGGSSMDTWRMPDRAGDLAAGATVADGLVVANADYGATRWLPRAAVTATATATAAAAALPRPTRTGVPADPGRPHRAFLPVVVRAAGGAAAPGALVLRRLVGGTAASVAVDGPLGFVAEGQSISVLRILSAQPSLDGPVALAELALGQPVRSVAATGGRLAALMGRAVAVADTEAFVLQGGAAEVQLVDTGDPERPRLAERVALGGPAVDVAAGAGASDGHFGVVGVADGQGYFALIDARDVDRAAVVSVPLALGADAVPIGVALDGPRAVVLVARGADTVLVRVDVADPARRIPIVGGTTAGLGLALGPGTVAMRGGPAFVVTDRGLQVFDATGRDLVRVGQTVGITFNSPVGHIAAFGDNAWLMTRDGEVLQVVARDGALLSVNFARPQHVDRGGLGRALAAGPNAALSAGGAVGGATVLGMPIVSRDDRFGDGGTDRALVGQHFGIGQVLAVTAGVVLDEAALPVAHAAMVDGRLQPLSLDTDGAVSLGTAITGRLEPPPLPLDDAAALGDIGVAVGPLTPLRAFTLIGVLSVSLGEAVPPFSARPLDQLRAGPSRRRVALADGFAWVAERQAGVAVFDLADTARLTSVGRVETPGQPRDLAVRGGWAFVADGTAGLTVVDARNPASPSEAGHLAVPGVASGVELADDGRTAYVSVEAADGAWLGGGRDGAALWAVDVARPATPRALDTVGLGLAAVSGMAGRGRWLYVAGAADDGGGAVVAVDVAVAGRPVVAAQWRGGPAGAVPRGVAVVGPHVVAALGEGGLAVLAARP